MKREIIIIIGLLSVLVSMDSEEKLKILL